MYKAVEWWVRVTKLERPHDIVASSSTRGIGSIGWHSAHYSQHSIIPSFQDGWSKAPCTNHGPSINAPRYDWCQVPAIRVAPLSHLETRVSLSISIINVEHGALSAFYGFRRQPSPPNISAVCHISNRPLSIFEFGKIPRVGKLDPVGELDNCHQTDQ